MKQAIAMMMALGLLSAVGCDSSETKKAEPKSDVKPDVKTDPPVATPDPKPPEPVKTEPTQPEPMPPPAT
jgi:predicted component of type VI protein secretion system